MSKLIKVLERVQKTKYTDIPPAHHIGASFERLIERYLLEGEFPYLNVKPKTIGLTSLDILNRKSKIDSKYTFFIRDPLGSSKHPDFLVVENGNVFYLECKTSRSNYTPMWGSAFPQGNDIWIFCCGNRKVNETAIFLGKDIVSEEQAKEMEDIQGKRLLQDKELHKILKEKYRTIGIDLRPIKFSDCSTKAFSPIFHGDRKLRETRVLEFVKNSLELDEKIDKRSIFRYNVNRILTLLHLATK